MISWRSKTRHAPNAGFTLIELTIVLLVLGILVGLGQPMLSASLTEARLDAATADIAAAMRYAQAMARSTGEENRVVYNVNAETVRVERFAYTQGALNQIMGQAKSTVAASFVESSQNYRFVRDPLRPERNYVIDYAGDVALSELNLVSANFGGSAMVIFRPDGSVSAGGGVVIDFGGRRRTISVSSLTGRISIS